MKKISIGKLAKIINAAPPKNTSGFITGVSTDSRTVKPGDCFFAVKGENFDGHDYIARALGKKAACVVASSDTTSGNVLKVQDSVKALGCLAAHYRNDCNFKVVAITGSVGKTTTRQITYHVLSKHFKTFQAPANFNNSIGLPMTLLAADPDDQIIIAELGSSYTGEIEYLTKIAAPDIAVVTKICLAHLEGLKDLEAIKKEKLSIAQGLKPDGVLITDAASKLKPQNPAFKESSTTFSLNGIDITLPLLGQGNIENAITAFAICEQFGITLNQFADAIKTLPPIPMRTELIKTETLTILNDCYNANPASMKNALKILDDMNPNENQRKVFICGDMAELGNDEKHLHQQLGKDIADNNIQLLIAIGPLANLAAQAAKKIKKQNLQTYSFKDTISACNQLNEFIKKDDIVLIKGSRAAKLEAAVKKLKSL
ncbi:MAG: UDP-N-acetylmuramoyl-tripeptide--D-alanyl-D-alanine ligase [Planctomycetes bacterium]|nr:UDP-N-acetylmuramoyl-tripeptide--D-alanyl-D-alanine ligase [Planctomycetota bacterium]